MKQLGNHWLFWKQQHIFFHRFAYSDKGKQPPCADKWKTCPKMPSIKCECEKILMEGKCDKYYKDCRLTCGRCKGGKCQDYRKGKFCKEMMEAGKCKQVQVAKMCLKTCDMCTQT